jgi:hypothetical protein
VGSWKLAPEARALDVVSGGGGWSNSAGDVNNRSCLFDDLFVFAEDGSFSNQMGGSTWIEAWQGTDPEACGAPVAPHDGSGSATYEFDTEAGTITLTGVGAHLGLAKVISGGDELTSPNNAPESIVYKVMESTETSMTVEVAYSTGFWIFKLVTADYVAPEPEDPCALTDSCNDTGGVINYGPGAFGGAIVSETDSISFSEGGVFIFPSGAEDWAGFAISGISSGTYPLSFMEAGSITFTGYISEGGSADIRFQLQFQEHPDVDPAYDTATVTVSGATPTTYTVEIPSQGNNTFSSLIMYLETVDVAVTVTDVVVSSDADNVDSVTPNNQIIKVANTPKGILGKATVLEVSYDTGDSNNQLTGIGIRVHFNSSLLSFKQITNLVEQDIIVNGQGPFNDEDDFDNDPLTDQYISFGWASLLGNWPDVDLPAVLMNIAFDVSDAIDMDITTETSINFSHSALASGYQFESESYNLELVSTSWDFDGSGHADALTDGLMMLRYCFGLRGTFVTDSAMSPDSPMSSEQVVAEIESALIMADIDDDGEVGALTDGLMLLRYLFGLRGDQITASAVGTNANRTSNEAIEAYLEAYMPAM